MLTEALVRGSLGELRGLKENVIVGRLIPGLAQHEQRRRSRGGSFLDDLQKVTATRSATSSKPLVRSAV